MYWRTHLNRDIHENPHTILQLQDHHVPQREQTHVTVLHFVARQLALFPKLRLRGKERKGGSKGRCCVINPMYYLNMTSRFPSARFG